MIRLSLLVVLLAVVPQISVSGSAVLGQNSNSSTTMAPQTESRRGDRCGWRCRAQYRRCL